MKTFLIACMLFVALIAPVQASSLVGCFTRTYDKQPWRGILTNLSPR
jgi:hypothetical protein